MIVRMYSTKYFCKLCLKNDDKVTMLFSEIGENGERKLMCEKHGFQQLCNCSPNDFVMKIIED